MMQTLQYLFAGRSKWKEVESEIFTDPEDQHTFSVHWATPLPTESQKQLYVLVPGMLTNHTSKYISYFVNELKALGPTCICNMPLLSDPATGNSIPNYSDDRYLRHFLDLVALRHPQCQITLVGTSMGGTIAIKCSDLADKVVAICSPIRGKDSWNSIQGIYYTALRTAFVAGPMARLIYKQPSKWTSSLLSILKAKDAESLGKTLEEQASYVIREMSIEPLMLQLPKGKVLLIHTKDDQIIPYIPDESPLFDHVKRITLNTGGHLCFSKEEVRDICNLVL